MSYSDMFNESLLSLSVGGDSFVYIIDSFYGKYQYLVELRRIVKVTYYSNGYHSTSLSSHDELGLTESMLLEEEIEAGRVYIRIHYKNCYLKPKVHFRAPAFNSLTMNKF